MGVHFRAPYIERHTLPAVQALRSEKRCKVWNVVVMLLKDHFKNSTIDHIKETGESGLFL